MSELPKSFEPAAIEARWAPLWEGARVGEPTLDPSKPPPPVPPAAERCALRAARHEAHRLGGAEKPRCA